MKSTYLSIWIFLLIAGMTFGCASKKRVDTRMEGMQKQISYLSESYKNLSIKLSELQDSLLVLQTKAEMGNKQGIRIGVRPTRKNKATSRVRQEPDKIKIKPEESEVPVFELSMESKELAGQPGKIFKLDDGKGFIKIEGATGKERPKLYITKSSPGKDGDPGDRYKTAFSHYSKKSYDSAIKSFSTFLESFPEHDLSDNAVYWIGESYVAKGKYALALPEFQRIPLEYPNGNKVPDALLMQGICLDKLKYKDGAVKSWKKLVNLYPDTTAAKKAKKRLEDMESKGTS